MTRTRTGNIQLLPGAEEVAKNADLALRQCIRSSCFLNPRLFENQNMAPILMREMIVGDLVGTGAFSGVYEVSGFRFSVDEDTNPLTLDQKRARQKLQQQAKLDSGKNGCRFVVKHLMPEIFQLQCEKARLAANDLFREALFLASINHTNILHVRGLSIHGPMGMANGRPDGFFLLMDRLESPLMTQIRQMKTQLGKKKPREFLEKVLGVACDIASAIKYLHKNGIMHRDLKPSNLGFASNGKVQLFDFGLDVELPSNESGDKLLIEEAFEMLGGAGTFRYMAPEIALHKPYNLKADVYSFSGVLYEMLTLEKFGSQYDKGDDSFSIAVHCNGLRPHTNFTTLSGDLQELLEDGWANEHQNRPFLKEQHTLANAPIKCRRSTRLFRHLNSCPASISPLDVNRRRKDYGVNHLQSKNPNSIGRLTRASSST